MPKVSKYTSEFKADAVRTVFELIGPTESRKEACRRLAAHVGVRDMTLYNWVKDSTPEASTKTAGQIEMLRAEIEQLKLENRELARSNEILISATALFASELDRLLRKLADHNRD